VETLRIGATIEDIIEGTLSVRPGVVEVKAPTVNRWSHQYSDRKRRYSTPGMRRAALHHIEAPHQRGPRRTSPAGRNRCDFDPKA